MCHLVRMMTPMLWVSKLLTLALTRRWIGRYTTQIRYYVTRVIWLLTNPLYILWVFFASGQWKGTIPHLLNDHWIGLYAKAALIRVRRDGGCHKFVATATVKRSRRSNSLGKWRISTHVGSQLDCGRLGLADHQSGVGAWPFTLSRGGGRAVTISDQQRRHLQKNHILSKIC